MGKPKKRKKPCSRGDECCMLDPCQRSEMKKAAKKDKKKKKKKAD